LSSGFFDVPLACCFDKVRLPERRPDHLLAGAVRRLAKEAITRMDRASIDDQAF